MIVQIEVSQQSISSGCLSLPQAQYVFIHDSLSELVMCGETEVVAGDLRMKIMSLQNPVTGDTSGLTGFEKQFQVLTYWYEVEVLVLK